MFYYTYIIRKHFLYNTPSFKFYRGNFLKIIIHTPQQKMSHSYAKCISLAAHDLFILKLRIIKTHQAYIYHTSWI